MHNAPDTRRNSSRHSRRGPLRSLIVALTLLGAMILPTTSANAILLNGFNGCDV